MFLQSLNKRRGGFTLIEMAIVLGIVGVLGAGLWRLMATGSQQTKDQVTAQQQIALIDAVKGFLADTSATGGYNWMGTLPPKGSASLLLPTSNTNLVNCQANTALPGFCNYLPPGFYYNALTGLGTTNPYGQTYSIRVLKDGSGLGTPPQTYSFMIMTNGNPIPDADGGRISGLIGGDGGFIYQSNVCGAGFPACGTMDAWSGPVSNYGFINPGNGGWIVSRTFVSPSTAASSYWLARQQIDPNYVYNTMSAPLFLGGSNMFFAGYNALGLPFTTGGGTMSVQGGKIDLGANSVITGSNAGVVSATGGAIELEGDMTKVGGVGGVPPNPTFILKDDCVFNVGGPSPTCGFVMTVSGSGLFLGQVNVNSLYADTFIYQTSDMRLKKDIKPLSDSLSDVMKVKPVSFTYKKSGKESMGVIAQDLEKIYPQLVTQGTTGFKSVNYDGLIAPLIGAVQELKKENDGLRDQLKDQAAQTEKLRQELDKLHPAQP